MSQVRPTAASPPDTQPEANSPKLSADSDVEEIELTLLVEGIESRYGYDFRHYSRPSLHRRVTSVVKAEQLPSISALQERLLRDPGCMARFLNAVSVSTTSMFRDPAYYRAFREKVVPMLRDEPFVRIWVPGCATGEEVYSLAIVLAEEGLHDRSLIYATDMSDEVIANAKQGVFALRQMQGFTRNYQQAGGTASFSDYYSAKYGKAIISKELKEKIVWAVHNLVTDRSFNEFQLVSCRNVLIYFDDTLRGQVLQLIYDSMAPGGYLALGGKESLTFTPFETRYFPVDQNAAIFRKLK